MDPSLVTGGGVVRRTLFVLAVIVLAIAAYFVGLGSRRPSEGTAGTAAGRK